MATKEVGTVGPFLFLFFSRFLFVCFCFAWGSWLLWLVGACVFSWVALPGGSLFLPGALVGWLVGRSAGRSVGRLVGWLVGWLVTLVSGWVFGVVGGRSCFVVGWELVQQ